VILNHAIDGPEDAPALVLAGSLGTDLGMWRPQVAALAADFRLVRVDVRGHGASPVPAGPYTIDELGNDVLDTVNKLGIERFHFAGLSIGGMIGQWLGAYAPECIDRLVLLFTAAAPPDPALFSQRAVDVRAAGTPEGLIEGLLPRWLTDDYRATHPAVIRWLTDMVSGCAAEGYASCAEAIAAMDLRPVLARISAPTLVFGGAQDGSLPPELGREIADAIPGARFELLDPAGHLGNIERADTINDLILEHLRR
jgi:3-oxoadipate enol-lactonase